MQSANNTPSQPNLNLKTLWEHHAQLILAGLLGLALYASWAWVSKADGDVGVYHLWSVALAVSALSTWIWNNYRIRQEVVPFSLLLVFAIAFRLLGIGAFPILEDDFYRFLWDGRVFVTEGSPYDLVPEDFFEADFSGSYNWILGQINHPDIATVYGPTCQWIFALCYLIAPGETWPLQLVIASADIALILLLCKLASTNTVLLYAWCPLVLKETVFSIHLDGIGACLIVAGLLCARDKRIYWAGLLLALAAGIKVFALMAVPFLLKLHWRGWLAFAATAFAISIPFGVLPAWLPAGLAAMNEQWLFNAPLYSISLQFFSYTAVKNALQIGFVLAWGCYLIFHLFVADKDREPRLDWVYACLLLAIPALNPWYLLWLLPFAVIKPSRWAWVGAVSVFLAYAIGLNLPESQLSPYEQLPMTMLAEFSLIAIAVILDLRARPGKINSAA